MVLFISYEKLFQAPLEQHKIEIQIYCCLYVLALIDEVEAQHVTRKLVVNNAFHALNSKYALITNEIQKIEDKYQNIHTIIDKEI